MMPKALFSHGEAEKYYTYKEPKCETPAWKGNDVWNIKVPLGFNCIYLILGQNIRPMPILLNHITSKENAGLL